MKKICVVFGFLSLFCASAMAGSGFSGNAVKIGVLVQKSGSVDKGEQVDSILAARIAVEDFTETYGNLPDGTTIELISADSKGKSDVAANTVKSWSEEWDVDFVTGLDNSESAIGAMKEAVKQKKITVSIGGIGSEVVGSACSNYSMQWMMNANSLALGQVKLAMEQGKRSFYIIASKNKDGEALEQAAIKAIRSSALGAELRGEKKLAYPEVNFKEAIQTAKDTGAQVILLAMKSQEASKLIKQLDRVNYNNVMFVPLDLDQRAAKTLIGRLDDLKILSSFYWNETSSSKTFVRHFFEKTKRMPEALDAGIYASVFEYLKSVKSTGTDDPDRVINYFKNKEGLDNNLIGKFKILMNGKMDIGYMVLKSKPVKEIKNGWDLFEKESILKPEDINSSEDGKECLVNDRS